MNIIDWLKDLLGLTKSFKNFADPSKPFVGYMTVNNWSSKDASKTLDKLVDNNVQCAPFEFFENPLAYADSNVQSRIKKFEKWLDAAEKRKIIIYMTLLNCNLGDPKTGHPEITAPKCDKQIMAVANQAKAWIKKYKCLYITPCGEGGHTSPTYERKLQNWCKASMPLSKLVNNWGSRPTGTDGMAFFCQHPASSSSPMAKTAWIMSDHSKFIAELNSYETVLKAAKKILAKGNPFIVYDFPATAGINTEALRALKDAQ